MVLLERRRRGLVLCLDLGHDHLTQSVADKISALMPFHPRLLLHTSRPIRWDRDMSRHEKAVLARR